MHLFIASIALLGLLAAVRAQDRRFSALAAFAASAKRVSPTIRSDLGAAERRREQFF